MADSSEILEVFAFDDVRGRGLRSLKPLKPGDKVLESNPVVFVLGNNVRNLCCDFCFSRFEDLQRCSKCKFARYCNRECQKRAWKDHKVECERVVRVSPNVPTDLVRLMARILQLENAERKSARKSGSSSAAFQSCSTYLDSLVSHHIKFEQKQREAFAAICIVLKQFVGEQHFKSREAAALFQLFGKISCNSFTISDAELQPLGVGMYQAPSLLNHSCCPNCVVVFSGTKLLVHATENINKGDELTISYTELCCPSFERKEDLKGRYFFECSCPRCSSAVDEDELMLSLQCSDSRCQGALAKSLLGELHSICLIVYDGKGANFGKENILSRDTIFRSERNRCAYFKGAGFAQCNTCGKRVADKMLDAKSEAIISKSECTLKQIDVLEKAANYQAILNLCETVLREQQGIFHKLHYRRVGILDKAMDACIFLELWNKALVFGLQTLEPYKLYSARNHPSVGIQLFRIGKLQVYLDKLQDGLQSLLQAEAILQVTHSGLPLVQDLRELIAQTMEELRGEHNNTQLQGVELI